jgi:hypothetical protein
MARARAATPIGKCGIKARWAAQPMSYGVARGARLALRRSRTAAATAVPAARFASGFTNHAGSDVVPLLFYRKLEVDALQRG